jgi:hypothetical protein
MRILIDLSGKKDKQNFGLKIRIGAGDMLILAGGGFAHCLAQDQQGLAFKIRVVMKKDARIEENSCW